MNESMQKSLQTQKEEISRIQEDSKMQFENLANKILEGIMFSGFEFSHLLSVV